MAVIQTNILKQDGVVKWLVLFGVEIDVYEARQLRERLNDFISQVERGY